MKTEGLFRFGDFQVDALARTLKRKEEPVTLNRRAFDVLLYLVQNPGRVISREELLKNVWSDTFVDENSLAQSISVLRRALAEKPGENSYLVTLPGRGYQFVMPVTAVAQKSLTVVHGEPSRDGNPSGGIVFQQHTVETSVVTQERQQSSLPGSQSSSELKWVGALAAVAILVAGIYVWKDFHRTAQKTPSTTSPRRAIAVLGFRNLSGRSDEAWLSTAIAEMLSTELVAGEKLRLVSGEDIARTKLDLPLTDADSLSRDTLRRLHRNLNSDFAVLGSYTVLGDKPETHIRLDVRLQDAAAGETIADVAVTGSEAELFDMVSQAGARLREKLGVEAISPVEVVSIRASTPSNRDAARLYSEGLTRLRLFDAVEAGDLLKQAIAADPKFALAHSALAEAWSTMSFGNNAKQEARQAYDLSSNLSREEKLLVEGRYREMNREFDKAIEIYRALYTLFPDNVDYGLRLAAVQSRGGHAHDALATVEALRRLPPPASDDPRIDLAEAEAWAALSDHKHEAQPLENAVQKARALGARLLLADARQKQCGLFGFYLGQIEDAIKACRESSELHAAAGDDPHAAVGLAVSAVIMMETDAPESIRLFQRALPIFDRVGNESGKATVLLDLGYIYEGEGDIATAEKMERQALASYQRLDDKKGEAKALGNLADYRVDRGDLSRGIQLYEESMQVDPEDTGRTILAHANIAYVHQLQGNLDEAEQGYQEAISGFEKTGEQNSAALVRSMLGNVLLEKADFAGARTFYERALAEDRAADEKRQVAEVQLSLAGLALEEGRPEEQEATVRQDINVFQKQNARDSETAAWNLLTRLLLAEAKLPAAKEAIKHASNLAARSQNPEVRWRTAIASAKVETAGKDTGRSAAGIAARKELAAVIAESRQLGYGLVELDARLVLAEIEIKIGHRTEGRAHLTAIEMDAKAKGYNLVAHQAAAARG
jgi:DNA-binding winged helix-turn-helix (wHTH) protein/tetratricopeptide (TPR) repeat protein